MLLLFGYLGVYHEMWGTGLILVPAGLGCIIGWAIEEEIMLIAGR